MPSEAIILEFIRGNPVFMLFTVLGCGYLLGRIRIGSFRVGNVLGTLLAA